MNPFDLNARLGRFYNQYPEAPARPVIGITSNFTDGDATLRDLYYKQVVDAGGTPIILPPLTDESAIVTTLEHVDAILLSGGADHNPLWAGEEPSTQLHGINAERDLAELLLTRLAFNRQIPMLGICRGIQTLAIALGGTVVQDIYQKASQAGMSADFRITTPRQISLIKHSQDARRDEPTHSVKIEEGSQLAEVYGSGKIFVNSFHHQAVGTPGRHLRVTATSADGVVEAVESTEWKPILGVQWHPEWLGKEGLKLFRWLVAQARRFSEAKALHNRILTLDTHCDTPMFFPQGVQFGQRDNRILYDLHKMTEGRQDAVIMAAYLPQPKMGERFADKVDIEGIFQHNPKLRETYADPASLSPMAYADLIFDKLEEIVDQYSPYISIARTPTDLYDDKRKGRRSIMFGIENGLALNHDVANVRHFAQRGVVYITLCHNGDNDICDSARGSSMHGGVSAFGRKVIEAMNREGMMVDLSHAAEKSFYDALEISKTPIVCSHSSARALCDHPRNLTDDQMRALARNGGVCQITLYKGFLRKEGDATIIDALNHLEHAISVMGIDHVGIGTDFDGDGTVRGCADASELIQFTQHLLRRKYSEQDIAKIWGGNWLRVMSRVQAYRG